jgi:predicted transcriptional regulator
MEQNIGTSRVQVHAHVEPEVRAELLELARRDDRSVSSLIRQALKAHVEREQAAADPAGVATSRPSRSSG